MKRLVLLAASVAALAGCDPRRVENSSDVDIYVYLMGADVALGAAFRLEFPAEWDYRGWVGDCLAGQLTILERGTTSLGVATANHGCDFVAAIQRGNVYGTQFHPEKSHRYGMNLLRQFAESAA